MAVPRHKMSKMKQRSRRGQDALSSPARSVCPRCNAEKLPHRICGNCGYYRGGKKLKIGAGEPAAEE